MATTPYFLWPPHSSSSTGAPDSDTASGFGTGLAPEMSLLAPATTTTTAAADTARVSPERGTAATAVARPRMRRNVSSGSGKQQQAGGGGAKKPPQRGLGVAELERLRCGGDPLRELGLGVVGGDAVGAQVHPLLHCNHPHHHAPANAFDAATARYCSSLLVQQPPPPLAPPRPAGPGCYVHHPASAVAGGQQRAPPPPLMAPEQQYFMDRWGRMGGFTPTGGSGAGGGDHQTTTQLLPLLAPPEHPSSQNTIWRPAASSSSSTCLQSGHRCDLCSRRMMRALAAERGAQPPATPPSPTAAAATATPDYSIYDLAAAMATARQGEAFQLARDRKRGAVITGEEAARKEVREIEFFPAASTNHGGGGGVTGRDESEFVAPMSSSYGSTGGSYAAAPLDLSLRL